MHDNGLSPSSSFAALLLPTTTTILLDTILSLLWLSDVWMREDVWAIVGIFEFVPDLSDN